MARSSLNLSLRNILRRFPLLKGALQYGRDIFQKALSSTLRRLRFKNSFWGMPCGFYSGATLINNGFAEGQIVLSSQQVPLFSDESLVKKCQLGQDGFQPWPVFWMRIPEAFLAGRALVPKDRNGNLLAEATFSQIGDRTDPAFQHFSLGHGRLIHGNATSIVSHWGGDARGNRRYGGAGYWHWLFDSVARLSLIDRFPPETQVITPPLSPWMRWFLERLNLGSRILETEATALRVENFYFSSPSSMTGCWNPYAVNFLRKSFLPFGSPPSDSLPKRFYILREGYTRKIANESEVRELFTANGWSLIAPEKLSIPDQIALFRDAEAIAGLHGSALTNLLWCPPSARVLEFVPNNFMAGAFEWLARNNGLSHQYLLCDVNRAGDAIVDIPRVELYYLG
jgi:Glycosyltransferase 61